MTPEEQKIFKEDCYDLNIQLRSVLNNYLVGNKFIMKDRTVIDVLANLVGNFLNCYAKQNEKMQALDEFMNIIQQHLEEDFL